MKIFRSSFVVTLAAGASFILSTAPLAPAVADVTAPLGEYAPAPALDSAEPLPDTLKSTSGRVSVFVQTTGDGALQIQRRVQERGRSQAAASDAAQEQVTRTEQTTAQVANAAESADPDAEVLYTSAYTVPGVALSVEASILPELIQQQDVVRISAIVPRSLQLPTADEPANGNSDALTRAVDAWQQTGKTGDGVTVAVVDTGLDYTHADFGGPASTEAYNLALNSTDAPQRSWYDDTKYLGGFDFAGASYNADPSSPAYNPHPQPDANPIDGRGGGHGTHVAGTAAGFGVQNGVTYRSGYETLSAEEVRDDFTIAPGSAPQAGLISLKVFGDGGGSTDVTGAALEWIGEAIASGRSIDVVNLSLGTNYGSADDPDNRKLSTLMDAGVLPVVAAGNSGDVTDILGSPGTTGRALTVAASASGRGLADAVAMYTGDPSSSVPAQLPSQFSQNYTAATFNRTARVVRPSGQNLSGCDAFDAIDRATVSRNIVLLDWDDADVACGSAARFDNAASAGAVGVLLTSQTEAFEAGIAGNAAIPGAQLTSTASTRILTALATQPAVFVRLDSAARGSIPVNDTTRVDTLASFSSRGVHGSVDGIVKPDVSAPGVQIISASHGSGAGPASLSGTSMATPHTAGIAALVTQAHPDWTPDQVKKQIMNTATADVTTGGSNPVIYSPLRAGTGRVDALSAVTSTVQISSAENGGLVTASFGVVEVGGEAYAATRTLTVRNTGNSDAAFTAAYLPRTQIPGVEYSIDRSELTIPAGQSAELTLTLRIADPAVLRKTLDPTMADQQGGAARQYLADASGIVELQPTATTKTTKIRLAVSAAPKPVSDTAVDSLTFDDGADTGMMRLTGRGVNQGEGSQAYVSQLVPLQLGVTDPDDTFPEEAAATTLESADIIAVGASSTAPQLADPSHGLLTIGVVMDGAWSRITPLTYPVVSLDVNGDTRTDFHTYVQPAGSAVDLPLAVTVDASTDAIVDRRPVNNQYGDIDTNIFDNQVMTLPVSLTALGYTPGTTHTTVAYSVQTQSYYAPDYAASGNALVDETATATFDVYSPQLWFEASADTGAASYHDTNGTLITHRASDARVKALVLHLHGATDERAEIVDPTVNVGPTPGEPEPGQPEPGQPQPQQPGQPNGGGGTDAPESGSDLPSALASTGSNGNPIPLVALAAVMIIAGALVTRARVRRSRRE